MEELTLVLDEAKDAMEKAIGRLEKELLKIRAGKANPVMLQSVMVDYYGAKTPLQQLAACVAEDGRTLKVTPFDRSSIAAIERGILEANLGFNPQNDGSVIRIAVPMLTGDRRKDLVKQAKAKGEESKVAIRAARKSANDELKSFEDDNTISEDHRKNGEADVQQLTNDYVGKVDARLKQKEEEITTV